MARRRVQFYAAGLRGSEILVKRQWLSRRAQEAVAAKDETKAFAVKTTIHDDRFVVEMAIPWQDLPRLDPKQRVFRLNIQRGKRKRAGYEEVSNWFPGAEGPGNLDARGWLVLR